MSVIVRLLLAFAAVSASTAGLAAGDVTRGAQAYRACAACHSLAPGEHRTGPSLAAVYGRRAGAATGFHRYSKALRQADIVWSEATLDAWLRDPAALVPGTTMAFRGLPDAQVRGDLIAYLQAVSEGKVAVPAMPAMPDLKALDAGQRVKAIRHCADTYFITLADGATHPFWEFNLRFKTDTSARGPRPGEPVIVGAGMGGDRAQVVFASPTEISPSIKKECRE